MQGNLLFKESNEWFEHQVQARLMRLQSCRGLTEEAGFGLGLEGRKEFSQSGERGEKDILYERTVCLAKTDLKKGKRVPCCEEMQVPEGQNRFPCQGTQGNKAGWVGVGNQSMKGLKCHAEKLGPTVGPLANHDVY